MGQKTNPIGLRVAVNKDWRSKWYAGKKEFAPLLAEDAKIRSILKKKLESVKLFEDTLRNTRSVRAQGEDAVELTVKPAEFELWLGFVNDMRIVLGTELDIQEDGWSENFDPEHPKASDFALLHYLSWLEEELLRAHPTLP